MKGKNNGFNNNLYGYFIPDIDNNCLYLKVITVDKIHPEIEPTKRVPVGTHIQTD